MFVTVLGISMFASEATFAFRPAVSVDDWKVIMSAISAYSHNAEYRELLGRLERQAKVNGITLPAPRLS
ncbi:hypothetical protein [Paracoccus sp. AK26]|uniref:hypothetical protein n=1 Tax=Paracoccus sp. AK26 TaxID=2589076 RepID=UPI0014281337|nr:hypothetical protein [Paracoccus sp. AK26]QIR86692.1 hypothetical protein FIU66_15470 [Paracoccus sp. AK26]